MLVLYAGAPGDAEVPSEVVQVEGFSSAAATEPCVSAQAWYTLDSGVLPGVVSSQARVFRSVPRRRLLDLRKERLTS